MPQHNHYDPLYFSSVFWSQSSDIHLQYGIDRHRNQPPPPFSDKKIEGYEVRIKDQEISEMTSEGIREGYALGKPLERKTSQKK